MRRLSCGLSLHGHIYSFFIYIYVCAHSGFWRALRLACNASAWPVCLPGLLHDEEEYHACDGIIIVVSLLSALQTGFLHLLHVLVHSVSVIVINPRTNSTILPSVAFHNNERTPSPRDRRRLQR